MKRIKAACITQILFFSNHDGETTEYVYIVVDMELKGLIREALIKMILGFDIALEIEEE